MNLTSPSRHTTAHMGDSLTFASETFSGGLDGGTVGSLTPVDHHPYKLQQLLAKDNIPALCRNFGIGGNTTAQMIARQAALVQYEIPVIACIEGGYNDANAASTVASAASASVFTVQTGMALRLAVAGSWVVVNGQSRKVLSVAGDVVTLATALSATPTAGTAVTLDTRANLAALVAYVKAAGCSRVMVIGLHMMNQTSGGETPNSPSAFLNTLRTAQAGAATDAGAVYVDLFAYFAAKVTDGTYVVNSGVWMAATSGDPHLNPLGQQLMAQAEYASIQAQAGWIAALSS